MVVVATAVGRCVEAPHSAAERIAVERIAAEPLRIAAERPFGGAQS